MKKQFLALEMALVLLFSFSGAAVAAEPRGQHADHHGRGVHVHAAV